MLFQKEIRQAVRLLGLDGQCVCMHTSMRSFTQPVENGANGLLDAFLQSGCTVMVPAFSDMYEAPPVKEYMPLRNGAGNYSYFFEKNYENAGIYSPESNLLTTEEMGIFPQTVLQRPERMRGKNYLNSFAAIGPRSCSLISAQTNEDVYAPFAALYKENGYVLLLGVGLDCATAVHYAEQLAGRKPFIRWSKDSSGLTLPVAAGGCSDGFENLSPFLKSHEKQLIIGGSLWRCFRMRSLTDVCAEAIRRDPQITHCSDPGCARCNDAIAGGPDFVFPF